MTGEAASYLAKSQLLLDNFRYTLSHTKEYQMFESVVDDAFRGVEMTPVEARGVACAIVTKMSGHCKSVKDFELVAKFSKEVF